MMAVVAMVLVVVVVVVFGWEKAETASNWWLARPYSEVRRAARSVPGIHLQAYPRGVRSSGLPLASLHAGLQTGPQVPRGTRSPGGPGPQGTRVKVPPEVQQASNVSDIMKSGHSADDGPARARVAAL
ncbi:unnamed protein product [Merluccius merluccius]